MSHPTAAPGQIKVKYAKLEGDLYMCHGEGTSKADVNLLMGAVTDHVLEADFKTTHDLHCRNQLTDSVLSQLEARGYDPATLEISIRKKSI